MMPSHTTFSPQHFHSDAMDYYVFPTSAYTVVAKGGNFSAGLLLSAYEQGIFPWGRDEEGLLLWCSPDPRCVLYPNNIRINKTTRKILKNHSYKIVLDQNFSSVVSLCASTPRNNQDGSWIDDSFIEAYSALHCMGFAHSVSVYNTENVLVGGLYGLFLGSVFFGESMVSLMPNVSKIAFFSLVHYLYTHHGLSLVDCQMTSPHMLQWGATLIPHKAFNEHLRQHAHRNDSQHHWSGLIL